MIKPRLIATLIVKDGRIVQSIQFQNYLPVGDVGIGVEFFNRWGIDEIVILDIDASKQNGKPNFQMVEAVSRKGFVPLTVGGGVSSADHVRDLLRCGADKIVINRAAFIHLDLISKCAAMFGKQCIVASVDVRKTEIGYQVFSEGGKVNTGKDPVDWTKKLENAGAGEIFLNSIDRDGMKQGFDIELIKSVSRSVQIPIIACGGAGCPKHFLEAFVESGASAFAAANFFHFMEHSIPLTRAFLKQNGFITRLNSDFNYDQFEFDSQGRILKKTDEQLNELRFEIITEEEI